jgi:hypothetical protein
VGVRIPAWCTPLERTRIRAALDQLTASCVMQPDPVTVGRLEYPSEIAAVEAVVTVAGVVVPLLAASSRAPSPADRRRAIEDVVDGLIDTAAGYRPTPARPLEAFAATVREALQGCAWWRLSDPIPTPVRTADPAVDERPLLTLPDVGKRLGVSVKTLKRMARKGTLQLIQIAPKSYRVPPAELEQLLRLPKYRYPDRKR